MKLTIPVSCYNFLSLDPASSVSPQCGTANLIFHSCFFSHCGGKNGQYLEGEKKSMFLKMQEIPFLELDIQLINFEFSGSKVLSWRATLFPYSGCNMAPWSKWWVWHMRHKRGLSYCTEGRHISKVAWIHVFGKTVLRQVAASIRRTVLKESVKSFRWRNTLGFYTETLLRVQFPQQRSEMAILQCIEPTSAVEEY